MTKNIGLCWIKDDFRIQKNLALSEASKNHDQVVAFYLYKKKIFLNQEAQQWWVSKSLVNFQKILKPKITFKLSPNDTKDLRNNETRIDVNNIYDLNRLASDDTVEGGVSLAYGNDFTIFDKKNSREIFGVKLANNMRISENHDLPTNNQMGQKTSNFLGEINYNPIENFSLIPL